MSETQETTPFDPAVLAVLVNEREASDLARAAAERRHARATNVLAAYLVRHGPRVMDGWRYTGLHSPALGGAVVRTMAGEPPVIAAHASVCITEDDGDIEP